MTRFKEDKIEFRESRFPVAGVFVNVQRSDLYNKWILQKYKMSKLEFFAK